MLDLVPRRVGEVVWTLLLLVVLLSTVLTVVVLRRTRTRVSALEVDGFTSPGESGGPCGHWAARLVPDSVLIGTFPRMTLVVDLVRLTGRRPS